MPIPTPRGEMAFTTLDEKIYVIGGFDKNEKALDVVEVYDTKTNTWATLAPLPEPILDYTCVRQPELISFFSFTI